MELRLSCYLVLLSIDSKTRQQDSRSSMTWPIWYLFHYFLLCNTYTLHPKQYATNSCFVVFGKDWYVHIPHCCFIVTGAIIWYNCSNDNLAILKHTLIARLMGPIYGAHLGPTGPRWAPCWPHKLCYLVVDGLVQERHNSSALAMELRLSCTNPLL